jgi:hypothetical protein
VRWSAKRLLESGQKIAVPVSRDSIAALNEKSFAEIEDAITKHIEEQAAEKKATSGSQPSAPN